MIDLVQAMQTLRVAMQGAKEFSSFALGEERGHGLFTKDTLRWDNEEAGSTESDIHYCQSNPLVLAYASYNAVTGEARILPTPTPEELS